MNQNVFIKNNVLELILFLFLSVGGEFGDEMDTYRSEGVFYPSIVCALAAFCCWFSSKFF